MTRKLPPVLVWPVLSEKLTIYSKKDQTRWIATSRGWDKQCKGSCLYKQASTERENNQVSEVLNDTHTETNCSLLLPLSLVRYLRPSEKAVFCSRLFIKHSFYGNKN